MGRIRAPLKAQQSRHLLQIERDFCTAFLKSHAVALGRLLADDCTSVAASGVLTTKADDVAALKAPGRNLKVCTDSNVKARVYGDAAVVTGIGTRSGTTNGVPFDRQFHWTDTFVRRDGRWQCVASHSTFTAEHQERANKTGAGSR